MKLEPVEIKVDGLTLRGKFYQPSENIKNLAVLFLHGWTGKPNEQAAQVLAENGIFCMDFSFSGHNDSDGKLEDVTREKSFKEAIAAYDYFKSKLPMDMRVVVCGNSYGGYMAMLLSSEREVAAMQLRVPANYTDDGFERVHLKEVSPNLYDWRLKPLDAAATKSLRAINSFSGQLQIIEAGNDELVPHQTVQNYVDAVKDKSKLDYHLMEGWPHSLGDDPERNRQYQEILLNWLNKISEEV